MTDADEREAWTPDAEYVRQRYIGSAGGPPRIRRAQAARGREFDTWLAARERAAERRGAAEALERFADILGVDVDESHDDDEWWWGYRQAQREHIRAIVRRAEQYREDRDV